MMSSNENSLLFERIKFASSKTKNIVNGYVRYCQSLLLSSYGSRFSPYYNIPDLISYIIMSYYMIEEYFAVYDNNDNDLELNESKYIVKSLNNADHTIYGNNQHFIYKWIFQIRDASTFLLIGIDSSNKRHINQDFVLRSNNDTDYYYAYGGGDLYASKNNHFGNGFDAKDWGKNDILTMELNTKQQIISINHTNKTENKRVTGIAFKNVAVKSKIFM